MVLASLVASAQDTLVTESPHFSKYFFETRLQLGPGEKNPGNVMLNVALGLGAQFACVPDRWGWYAGATYVATGYNSDCLGLQGGVVYRLLDSGHKLDIQLYSGLTCGILNLFESGRKYIRPGLDAGIRFAPGAKVGRKQFAWTSVTLGETNYWDMPFYTISVSMDITAVIGVFIMTLQKIH